MTTQSGRGSIFTWGADTKVAAIVICMLDMIMAICDLSGAPPYGWRGWQNVLDKIRVVTNQLELESEVESSTLQI